MRKGTVGIAVALLIISLYGYALFSTTWKIQESDTKALSLEARNGSILDFDQLVEGDWNRMCIITPYTPLEDAVKATGLNLERMENYSIHYRDDVNLWVFSKDMMVRKYYYVPRSIVNVEPQKIKSGGYEREEAIFMVETRQGQEFLAHMDDRRTLENGQNKKVDEKEVYATESEETEKIDGSEFTIRWLKKGYYRDNYYGSAFSGGLIPLFKDDKWGYMDKSGRIVISLMYDEAHEFSEGLASVKLDQKYGAINWWNEVVIPMEYDYMGDFSQGRVVVIRKEVQKNKPAAQFGFSYPAKQYPYSMVKEKHGFIDRSGNEVIPMIYDRAGRFSYGRVPLFKDGIWSVANLQGEILYSTVFDYIGDFSPEGIAVVSNEFGHGFMDKDGHLIGTMKYRSAEDFSEGLALVEDNGYYFVNTEGKKALNFDYDFYVGKGQFAEGRMQVVRNRKFGFIDRYGLLDIPYRYEGSKDFSEGLAEVCIQNADKESKWGYIDKNNRQVVPMIFDETNRFAEGVALVRQGERWGILYRPSE